LENGLAELGTKNRADMALAGYFKDSGVSIETANQWITGWAASIPDSLTHVEDSRERQTQSQAVLRAVYSSPQYSFSCGSMLSCGLDKALCEGCKVAEVKAKEVSLHDFALAENMNMPVVIEADAIGKDHKELLVPSKIVGHCIPNPDSKACTRCGMLQYLNVEHARNERTLIFDAKNIKTLELIDMSAEGLMHRVKRIFGVESRCTDFRYEVEWSNAQIIYLASRVKADFKVEESMTKVRAILLQHGLQLNRGYNFHGRVYSHPRSLVATFIVDKAEQLASSLETFDLPRDELDKLSIFQPNSDQTVMDKINDIHRCMISDFIFIFGRDDLILAVDAVYHSARWIPFQKRIIKGWMDILIIGDTGQGKTETVKQLMGYYNLGTYAAGETASRTGLLYNVQVVKGEDAWVSFGLLCRANGLLVAIDEAHAIMPADFREFTLVRSSGIVDVKRYAFGTAKAETRLICISNPRTGIPMGSYGYPVMSIPDVPAFHGLEDIRRFDYAVGLMAGDVDDKTINTDVRALEKIGNPYNAELCRNLILWVWTRRPEDIVIDYDTEKYVLEVARELASEYVPGIPLVESADIRLKIVRIATALAGRTYSTDDGKHLIVTKEHVASAVHFLERLYKSPALDYWGYSADYAKAVIPDEVFDRMLLDFKTSWPGLWENMARWMLQTNVFTKSHIKTSLKLGDNDVNELLSYLLNTNMLEITSRGQNRKTPTGRDFFHTLLHPEKKKAKSVIEEEDEL
jgi:hypothetical protein